MRFSASLTEQGEYIYERLRAVGNEEEAIEVIGALRELLELEDLLVPPKLGFHRPRGIDR